MLGYFLLMQSELLHNDMPMIDAIWCVYERNILFQPATGYVDLSNKKKELESAVPDCVPRYRILPNSHELN